MLRDLFIAFRSFKEAHQRIRKTHLVGWVFLSGILYAGFLSLFFYRGFHFYNTFTDHFFKVIRLRDIILKTKSQSPVFFIVMGKVFLDLLMVISFFSVSRLFFFLVLSPLTAYITIRTKMIASVRGYLFHVKKFIRLASKYLFWLLVYLLVMLLVAWIPVLGWFAPFVFLFIEAFLFGSFMLETAASNENHHIPLLLSKHNGLAIGNGFFSSFLHLIPVLGWILIPTYSICAASISLEKIQELND